MTDVRSLSEQPASPLLTIAIPTWNRATYLERNLAQLRSEMQGVSLSAVEVLVSDNCSPDATPSVVAKATQCGLPMRYVRNAENIGWGRNFAQCFDLARGKYVLLLGDDDLLVDGALRLLLARLAGKEYGVVCLRPYGFDADFRHEFPGRYGGERSFGDAAEFLMAIGPLMTLISSCVVNRRFLAGVDTKQNASGDLAALPLVLRAALAADENLFIDKYLIASKRNNSFAYEYSQVFVDEMWRIIDAHVPMGLGRDAIRILERNMLLSYYPYYLLDVRIHRRSDLKVAHQNFARRFRGRWLFEYWLAPIIRWPRPLAIVWGSAATLVGRALGGELRRGIVFVWSRLKRSLASKGAKTS